MATSGSDKRKRTHALRVRLSDDEHTEVRSRADRAGVSVSAYFRACALDTKPLRAERQPAINRREVARLIGELGSLREALREAARHADSARCTHLIETFDRDFWELRAACFESLGREP
jgi:hypothetical protein